MKVSRSCSRCSKTRGWVRHSIQILLSYTNAVIFTNLTFHSCDSDIRSSLGDDRIEARDEKINVNAQRISRKFHALNNFTSTWKYKKIIQNAAKFHRLVSVLSSLNLLHKSLSSLSEQCVWSFYRHSAAYVVDSILATESFISIVAFILTYRQKNTKEIIDKARRDWVKWISVLANVTQNELIINKISRSLCTGCNPCIAGKHRYSQICVK